jgi:hypothetical protein
MMEQGEEEEKKEEKGERRGVGGLGGVWGGCHALAGFKLDFRVALMLTYADVC